jgi:hypothetical protein
LRWINAELAKSVHTKIMDRFNKSWLTLGAAPDAQPGTVRNLPALAEQHDLVTVPAAWPTGVSQLARAVDACQRRNTREVCTDWLARAQFNRAAAGFLPR